MTEPSKDTPPEAAPMTFRFKMGGTGTVTPPSKDKEPPANTVPESLLTEKAG